MKYEGRRRVRALAGSCPARGTGGAARDLRQVLTNRCEGPRRAMARAGGGSLLPPGPGFSPWHLIHLQLPLRLRPGSPATWSEKCPDAVGMSSPSPRAPWLLALPSCHGGGGLSGCGRFPLRLAGVQVP